MHFTSTSELVWNSIVLKYETSAASQTLSGFLNFKSRQTSATIFRKKKKVYLCAVCASFQQITYFSLGEFPSNSRLKKNLLRRKKKKIYRCVFFPLLLLFLTCRCASRVAWEFFFSFFFFYAATPTPKRRCQTFSSCLSFSSFSQFAVFNHRRTNTISLPIISADSRPQMCVKTT